MNTTRDQDPTHLWLILCRATSAVNAHAGRHIESLGLCGSDFAVLEALHHKGPLPVNRIGEKVLLTSGSITTAVDRLERRGLVSRTPDPQDRRSRVVTLTEPGRRLIGPAFAAHVHVLEDATAGLTAGERAQLTRLLRKLGHHAAQTLDRGEPRREKRETTGGIEP